MSHTKEPWSASQEENEAEWGIDSGKWGIAICAASPGNGTAEANARRIVACVNACAGISTDNLEENLPVKELARRYNAALRQRDELLAALKSVNESAVCFAKNEYSISADAISKVENAIAGVKGGAA